MRLDKQVLNQKKSSSPVAPNVVNKLLFPREMGLKRKECSSRQMLIDYIRRLNGKSSLYMSLFSFREKRVDKPWKFNYKTAVLNTAWWDFDSGEKGDIDAVKTDVSELINRLGGASCVSLVATGRGFHVYQPFTRSVIGHEWRSHLVRYERKMAKGLATLDGVGLPEKLVRIPNTYNPSRGRWSVPIDPEHFMADPHGFIIPKKPTVDSKSLCPFLGVRTVSETHDLVRWAHDNPEPKTAVVGVQNASVSNDAIGDIPVPPCISKGVKRDNPTHFARIALVQYLSEELRWFAHPDTLTDEQWESIESQIYDHILSLGWRDFNERITRIGIRSNMKYKQSPTCKSLSANGMCPERCFRYDGTMG